MRSKGIRAVSREHSSRCCHQVKRGAPLDSRSVLVFPAGMPSSLMWARHATESGLRVVGASSLAHDPGAYQVRRVDIASLDRRLQFRSRTQLLRAGAEYRRGIHRASGGVAHAARTVAEDDAKGPIGGATVGCRAIGLPGLSRHRSSFRRAPLELAAAGSPEPLMLLPQLAALVRMFQLVPGQCDHPKLEALIAIFRWMPAGDIVEIGSLWGRSAMALAFLARHYRIGNLLCVDPWRTEEVHQAFRLWTRCSMKRPWTISSMHFA